MSVSYICNVTLDFACCKANSVSGKDAHDNRDGFYDSFLHTLIVIVFWTQNMQGSLHQSNGVGRDGHFKLVTSAILFLECHRAMRHHQGWNIVVLPVIDGDNDGALLPQACSAHRYGVWNDRNVSAHGGQYRDFDALQVWVVGFQEYCVLERAGRRVFPLIY